MIIILSLLVSMGLNAKTVYTYDDYITNAEQLIKIGNNKQAVSILARAIAMDPKKSSAYNLMGLASYNVGNYEKALENFKKALSYNPDSADLNYYTGVCLANQKKYPAAVQFMERAVAIEPTHYGALLNLGAIHQINGDNKAAIETYNRLLETKPNDFEANFNLGKLYAVTSEKNKATKNKAVALLEKAQKANPSDVRTYEQLIKLYRELNLNDKVTEQENNLKNLKGKQ